MFRCQTVGIMNTIALAEQELPLHEHLQELPRSTLALGKRVVRHLTTLAFCVVLIFSILVVAVLMLFKGLSGRKKAFVGYDAVETEIRSSS